MPKYIRTKNGIHLRKIFDEECSDEEWKSLGYTIIKQADTIEELCDKFVVVDKERHIQLSDIEDTNEEYLKRKFYVSNNYTVYGAIWTDKGLIYVAKINDKGELYLI